MKREQIINEIQGIVIWAVALILLASLISFAPDDLSWYSSHPNIPAKNLVKIFGAYAAGGLLWTIGYSVYVVVFILFFWGWDKFISRKLEFSWSKLIGFILLFCGASALFAMCGAQATTLQFQRAGMAGLIISKNLILYFGRFGAFTILFALTLSSLILIREFLVSPFLAEIPSALKDLWGFIRGRLLNRKERLFNVAKSISGKAKLQVPEPKPAKKFDFKLPQPNIKKEEPLAKPQIRVAQPVKEDRPPIRDTKPIVIGEYHLPTLDLLKDAPAVSSSKLEDDLSLGAKILEETLAEFGVIVRVADVERGPVITRYELEPAPGVKVQQITTLTDDIALVMKAQSIRVVAPIPGKNRVGIEVPNLSSSLVFLKDVLASSEFRSSGSKLLLALGKDTAGKSLIANLDDMPHLLIAGTTGSGKTVCVNSIIMSILFNAAPHEVKFLIIDPKMVELSNYSALPHALCPAITDPKKVAPALNWVVGEMQSRYVALSKEGVRNIKSYHAKGKKMPYIVIIVDELADLMQVAARQVESAITRLAQLSRAVGIHLILATQRPSVDVITGVIKANFSARISFKVASKVDSRTVLDMNGAEKLLGKGDMLFMKPGESKLIRGQCCFVSDEEIQKVIDFIKPQQQPSYDEGITKSARATGESDLNDDDDMYEEALRVVLETNQASVTILQRRLRLGYARAARLIDIMERRGIVGPYVGSKPRDILINREEWLSKNTVENGQSNG